MPKGTRAGDGVDREIAAGIGALALALLALAILWSPPWSPGWASAAADVAAGLCFLAIVVFALRARLDFLKAHASEPAPTALGSALIGVVFAILIAAFAAGALYALSAKHGLYQPFAAAPTRLQTLAFFLNEALKGALFDVMDVFAIDVPGAPSYDAQSRWGFALGVVLFRLAAAFAVWSLIFGYLARGRRRD